MLAVRLGTRLAHLGNVVRAEEGSRETVSRWEGAAGNLFNEWCQPAHCCGLFLPFRFWKPANHS